MRTRLIVAFIVVALLAALASVWFNNLIVPFYGWPSWLGGWITWPSPLIKLLYHRTPHHPAGETQFVDAETGLHTAGGQTVGIDT